MSSARILHVLRIYRPDFTGEGIFFERCSAAMDALDPSLVHDLLVTHTPEPPPGVLVSGMISRVIYLTRRPLPVWRHHLALAWWFLRNVHRYRCVHVRTHVDWYFGSYLLTKLFRRRLVLSATLDDSLPTLLTWYRPSLRRIALAGFRLFDAYVSISPKLHAEMCQLVPTQRCHLIDNGIYFPDTNRDRGANLRARLGIPADALVLIFVGALCERKDPLLLLRNHAAILEAVPDCRLLLVGPETEPEYVTAMRRFVAENGLADRVMFCGEAANPHLYLEAADIMTFASRLEGFGMVVPEAMGHGLPVVVRALPGVNDGFLRDGETGFAFDDEAGYRRAVLRLAGDADLRARIGATASRFVRARYDMMPAARSYLSIYGANPPKPAERLAVPADLVGPVRSASIWDSRFHAPAIVPVGPPRMIVLVDAEEAFDWGQPFSRDARDVRSMRCQELAQRIFERHGVRPTYLVDDPVATQDDGRAPLRELLRAGACDVGVQLHSWVSPPFAEEVTAWNSFAGNLPVPLEYEKLRRLRDTIAEAFDVMPRIYRAGRYGAGRRTAEMLTMLGFEADASTMPHWDFRPHGGPDDRRVPDQPYWINTERTLLEIPNSAALVGRLGRHARRTADLVFRPGSERIGIPAALVRLGLLERIKLTPEGTSVEEAKRLIRHMLAQGNRSFVVTYHSTSLQPGNTPYVKSADDLQRFLAWLDEVLGFFSAEAQGSFTTWHELRHDIMAAEGRAPEKPRLIPSEAGADIATAGV